MEGSKNLILAQEKIMLSPVVFGIKESKARDFGWVDNSDLTWSDVVQKAASGELQFAMTNPSSSNSGFSALVGVASALANKGEALQREDITAWLLNCRDFSRAIAHSRQYRLAVRANT